MSMSFFFWIAALLPVLLAYQALRLLFYIFQYEKFATATFGDVFFAFIHGLRFDLAAVLWVSLPWLMIWLVIPSILRLAPLAQRWVLGSFFLTHIFFMSFNVADLKFFSFSGKRITSDIFAIASDIGNVGFEIVTFYWLPVVLGVGLYALLGYALWRAFQLVQTWSPILDPTSRAKQIVVGVLLIAFFVVGTRGGFQLKPLRPVHAFEGVPAELSPLVLNSTFTLIRSPSGQVKRLQYFASLEETVNYLQEGRVSQKPPHFGLAQEANVILIILESFSLEYTGLLEDGPSYTPFLAKLAKDPRSRLFLNHYANGRRSIEAVPSLVAGIPSLMSVPYVSSAYQTNQIHSWSGELSNRGYETGFFHGAANGSMFFDSFAARTGFKKYYGKNEYPTPREHDDGSWGIFDEPFFLFTLKELDQNPKPFASVLFSLSSHHPYPIPQHLAGRFPKGTLETHEAIGYTDYALEQFLLSAQDKSWFNKTIFILTADHTSLSQNPNYQTVQGPFRVPLIIFAPGLDLPAVNTERISQHIDLPKTILNLLGVETSEKMIFGEDVFFPGAKGEAFNLDYPGHWYLNANGLYRFADDGKFLSFQPQSAPDPVPEDIRRWQAWLQLYVNGLIENRWVFSTK